MPRKNETFDEEDVYTDEGKEEDLEQDAITDVEEGVIEGYEEGEHTVRCPNCGKEIVDENFVEREVEGEFYRFCCEECADEYDYEKEEG